MKITIDRATVEQALEAICSAKLCEFNSMSSRREMVRLMDEAITALKAALANQRLTDAQQEMERSIESLKAALAQQAEPVYWEVRCTAHPKWMRVDKQQFDEYVAHGWEGQRLYTAPPQRKPLMSDKDRPDQGATYIEGYGYVDTRAVRAIERAHGIKENAND